MSLAFKLAQYTPKPHPPAKPPAKLHLRHYSPLPKRPRLVRSPPRRYAPPSRGLTPKPPFSTVEMPESLAKLLREPNIVMERHLEMMNVFLGYEQANKYTLYNPQGEVLGYMEEDDLSITRAIMRQVTKLHRPFTVNVYDASGGHAMTIRRPFSFINSHIKCLLPSADTADENCIGESQQEWHLWRRRYNLYVNNVNERTMVQFGRVDAPFLSFQFPVANETGKVCAAVDRNWVGFGRELFTDTGVYVLRTTHDALSQGGYESSGEVLSLEQRAVLLATAVSVDFDYFSRHSNRSHMDFD